MVQHGLAPMGVFELTPVGLPIALVGLGYMLAVGRRLMPDRSGVDTLTDEFELRPYITEIRVLLGSPLAGKTLAEIGFRQTLGVTVLAVHRNGERVLAPGAEMELLGGDTLIVEGQREAILKLQVARGVEVHPDAQLSDRDLQAEDTRLIEAIILPGSPFVGRTLEGLRLRETRGLQMLAVNRMSGLVHDELQQVRFRMGDVLLLQGPQEHLLALQESNAFRVLGAVEVNLPRRRRAGIAIALFAGALALGASGVISLAVAALLGALLAFVTRCITPEEAYRRVEWRALILIACMLGLGAALQETGAAEFLATQIVGATPRSEPSLAARRLFRIDGAAHPAHVEPGRRGGRSAHRAPDRDSDRSEPPLVCDDDRGRRQLLLRHPAGARLSPGLRPRSLPVPRFHQGWRAPDDPDLRHRHGAHPAHLAAHALASLPIHRQ